MVSTMLYQWTVSGGKYNVSTLGEIETMTLKDRSIFILNGPDNCYIQEWNDVYFAIAMFVFNIFNTGKHNNYVIILMNYITVNYLIC